jgi:hypothetical protein
MTAFKKIGSIKNLEIASVCQLSCPYCPQRDQHEHRETGLMTDEVFDRSMFWLRKFVRAGTQKELNLFGVGEPLLHPKVVEFAAAARREMPRYLTLRMNTNGILVTEEIVRGLMDAGIDVIDITDHDAKTSMLAIRVFRSAGIKFGYSRDAITNPNNWGGLVDWTPSVQYQRYICPWLTDGCVMVMSDGNVTRCCQDAFARGILGTVWDDLDTIEHTPFVQCHTCHEDIPPGMEPWKPLSETNPYLKDPEERKKLIRLTVESSAAVEGVHIPKSQEKENAR